MSKYRTIRKIRMIIIDYKLGAQRCVPMSLFDGFLAIKITFSVLLKKFKFFCKKHLHFENRCVIITKSSKTGN